MVRFAAFPSLLLASSLAACGTGADFYVHGTAVIVDSTAAFTSRPDFQARVESTISASLQYWGGDWSALAGRSITLVDDPYVACGGARTSTGCYDGAIRMTTQDPSIGTFRCVEQTVLVHEIGHAVIGDPNHEDPRWMQLDPVGAELSGRTGYAPSGETDCTIWLSVWRHPLGSA